LTFEENKSAPVTVRWPEVASADFFRVFRDGQAVSETAVTFFPDAPMKASATYKVEAWRDNAMVAASDPTPHNAPDPAIDEKVSLDVQLNRTAVVLRWPDVKSPHVVLCRVYRSADQGATRELVGQVRVTGPGLGVRRDPRTAGRWIYTVQAVNAAGREFELARSQPVEVPPLEPAKPVLDLPLTSRPANRIVGDVKFDSNGASFAGGFISLPHSPQFDLGEAMTLTFDFSAREIDGMPVLLSHGMFGQDGWFVQILGGQLILRTPRGDAKGPPIEPGKWYSVRFVYDGVRFHLAVNDQWLPQSRREIAPKPVPRTLYIGRYEEDAPHFAFKGTIRNVRIFPEAVRQ
jgi:hypothetical protein